MQKPAAEVFKLICRGLDRNTILLYAAENAWSETPEQIDELIEEAFVELAKQASDIDADAEFGRAIVRLNRLFMDASKVQDNKTALAVQKEINKLLELKLRASHNRGSKFGKKDDRKDERPRMRIVT